MFTLPKYILPNFNTPKFISSPPVKTMPALLDGILPYDFYATTIYPEYFKIDGEWRHLFPPRMDCAVVINGNIPKATEARLIRRGDSVVIGRIDDGSNGVFVDYQAFLRQDKNSSAEQPFAFRTSRSRESSYSHDYDELYDILNYDRGNGYIVWVLGPAVDFDYDARRAMSLIIKHGYAHAVFAGNALATHDLEAALFHQDSVRTYTQKNWFQTGIIITLKQSTWYVVPLN